MLANFLIGLREGLEASLIVGILVAYLVKSGNRQRLPLMWAGVAVAIVISLGFGALLSFTSANMSFRAQEAFGGFLSILAVCFVTWMVFWMKSAARGLKGELQGKLDKAIAIGGYGIVFAAFIAVVREGLETALFIWAAVNATGQTVGPLIGAALGIAVAVLLGYLIYRGAVKLNMAQFFKITGVLLIIVAAGVLAYGFHDLQEAGVLPGLNSALFDVSSIVPPSSWYGTLLKGVFNFSPRTTWLEAIVWVGYLVPVMALYLRPAKTITPAPRVPAATTTV